MKVDTTLYESSSETQNTAEQENREDYERRLKKIRTYLKKQENKAE